MREIKFRAWDKLIGEMIDVLTIDFKTKGVNDDESYNMIPSLDGEYDLMQYTGLKDKNGKEVYEGDEFHLGDPKITYTVVWHDTGFMGKQNGASSFVGLNHWRERIEVIGNIYENPELLEHHNG